MGITVRMAGPAFSPSNQGTPRSEMSASRNSALGASSSRGMSATQLVADSYGAEGPLTPSDWHAESQETLENATNSFAQSQQARDISESKQRDVELATQKFNEISSEALRKKVLVVEAMRWVAVPIGKNIDSEIEDMARTVKLLLDTLEKDQNPYQATVTCVRLRAQRPARDQVEDEADECLNQQLVSLEIDATERLRRAVSELEQMKLRMRAMQAAMDDDTATKGRLTEVDVRCLDLKSGRDASAFWSDTDIGVGGWDASVAPWGSSQVQWDSILKEFDDHELEDQPGTISLETLLQIAGQICTALGPEVVDMMVKAADRDDDGTINHEEYVRGMRQFVLFQTAKTCVKDSKRLRGEVQRVLIQLENRIAAHHQKLLESLRASSATTCAYISQMEDKLSLNNEELDRVQMEIRKIEKRIAKSQPALRVAEQRLHMREKRPVQERWNDNPEEHLDTEVDGIKNAVCLLEDELENMIGMRARLQDSGEKLETEIGYKRAALEIDTTCFNIQTDWREFLSKYEVVPAGTPPVFEAPPRAPRTLPSKSKSAAQNEMKKKHPGWWCERRD